MLLIVQVLVAASIAGRVENVFLAFIAGFFTNIFLDLIPHSEIISRKYIPLLLNKNKAARKDKILFILDLILALILAGVCIYYADKFVSSDIFKITNTHHVLAAIIGVLIIPVLEMPYRIFKLKLGFSDKVFHFKDKLNLLDKGSSGYIVQIALIALSLILISQIIHTPLGAI